MEWNNEAVISLLEMYRARELLWNSKLKEYKNRNLRHDALLEIAISFGTDKEEIEKKIRYLQSHFNRERQRELSSSKSGAGTEDKYRSKWFAYKYMLFLKDKNVARTTVDTGERTQDNNTEDCMLSPDVDSPDSPCLISGEKQPERNEEVQPEKNRENQPRVFQSPRKKPAKKRKITPTNDSLVHGALDILKTIQSNHDKQDDEYKLFGDQVAMKIRKLASPQARFTVQNMINEILFQAEMGMFNRASGFLQQQYHPTTTLHEYYPSAHSTPTLSSSSPRSMTPSPTPSRNPTPSTSFANETLDGFLTNL